MIAGGISIVHRVTVGLWDNPFYDGNTVTTCFRGWGRARDHVTNRKMTVTALVAWKKEGEGEIGPISVKGRCDLRKGMRSHWQRQFQRLVPSVMSVPATAREV